MYVEGNAADTIKIPIVVEYKDALNNEYKDEFVREIRIFSMDELARYGAYKSKTKTYVSLLILLVIFYMIRKRKALFEWIKKPRK